jgi:hypothetical protein
VGSDSTRQGCGHRDRLNGHISAELSDLQLCLAKLITGKKIVDLSIINGASQYKVVLKFNDGEEITFQRATRFSKSPSLEASEKDLSCRLFDQISLIAKMPLASTIVSLK